MSFKRFQRRRRPLFKDLTKDELESEIIDAIKYGDVVKFDKLIEQSPKQRITLRCSDYRGFSILELSVIEDQRVMVKQLLEFEDVHLYIEKAVLVAVEEGNISILTDLLEKSKSLEEAGILKKPDTSVCFPRVGQFNLSPIMIAAIAGNVEMTRLLLHYGHYIQDPNHEKPKGQILCWGQCSNKTNKTSSNDSLKASVLLKNAYTASASPAYIVHTDYDPILMSFLLSKELLRIAHTMTEYKSDYIQLSEDCSRFATSLLNQCKDLDEVHRVLQRKEGLFCSTSFRFPRLYLAKILSQKEFIAHPNSQHVLRQLWVEKLEDWWSWSNFLCLFYMIFHAFLAPFVIFASIFQPDPLRMPFLRVPLNRAIYKGSLYLIFLTLHLLHQFSRSKHSVKGLYNSVFIHEWTTYTLLVFDVGNMTEMLQNIYKLGSRAFFGSFMHNYDFLLYSIFFVSRCLLIFSGLEKWQAPDFARDEIPWNDTILISECLNAFALVMAFLRVITWLRIHPTLGPMKATLRMMTADVSRFLVIMLIVIVSFAVGIHSIYMNYPKRGLSNDDDVIKTDKNNFIDFSFTLKNLFWGLYGKSDVGFANLVMPNTTDIATIAELDQKFHSLTELCGYILWGLFHTMTVIVLMNMLIAVMNDSFARVQSNRDVVWKFSRSSLWMSFLENEYTRPSPFNLIPSLKSLLSLYRALKNKSFSQKMGCFAQVKTDEEDPIEREEYMTLMKILVLRYLQREGTIPVEALPEEIPQVRVSTPSLPNNVWKRATRRTVFRKTQRSC